MNHAQEYFQNQMKNEEFRIGFFSEKLKLDLEFLIDDLNESIKSDKSKSELIKSVRKIKKTLTKAF